MFNIKMTCYDGQGGCYEDEPCYNPLFARRADALKDASDRADYEMKSYNQLCDDDGGAYEIKVNPVDYTATVVKHRRKNSHDYYETITVYRVVQTNYQC